METRSASTRLFASILGVLLAACSAPRYTAPASASELTRLVLVIRELPDGQVTHSWQRAERFDLSQYKRSASEPRERERIVLAAGPKRDCHAEYLECHRDCRNARLPPGYGHIPRGSARHDSFCWERCKQPYLDCERLQELQPQEFTALDGAIDGLKRNRKTLLVGSVIVIAGVAFIVVSAGAGLVVLAPMVLMASSGAETSSPPHLTAVTP